MFSQSQLLQNIFDEMNKTPANLKDIKNQIVGLEIFFPNKLQEKINRYAKLFPDKNKLPPSSFIWDEKVNNETLIICAARHGFYPILEYLLKKTPYVNEINEKKETALDQACKNDDAKIADLLIKHGANINQIKIHEALIQSKDRKNAWLDLFKKYHIYHGESLMVLAIQQNDFALIELLQDRGILFFPKDALYKLDDIHHGTQKKWVEFFIKINVDTSFKKILLDHMYEKNKPDLAELIFASGISCNPQKVMDYPKNLSTNTASAWIKSLAEHKADLNVKNKDGRSMLYLVTQTCDIPSIILLLKAGVNYNQELPLQKNEFHVLDAFLDHSPRQLRPEEIVKLFSNVSQPLSADDLVLAENYIKLFKKHGADLNTRDDSGNTMMDYARKRYDASLAQLLISYGVEFSAVDALNTVYKNPKSIKAHDSRWIDILLQSTGTFNFKADLASEGDTPLIAAAYFNHTSGVSQLLAAQPSLSVNETNTKEKTALYYAIYHKNTQMISELLSFGASCTVHQKKEIYEIAIADVRNPQPAVQCLIRVQGYKDALEIALKNGFVKEISLLLEIIKDFKTTISIDEEKIYALILKKLHDPDHGYYAISCLDQLYEHTNKEIYKDQLIQLKPKMEKEVSKIFENPQPYKIILTDAKNFTEEKFKPNEIALTLLVNGSLKYKIITPDRQRVEREIKVEELRQEFYDDVNYQRFLEGLNNNQILYSQPILNFLARRRDATPNYTLFNDAPKIISKFLFFTGPEPVSPAPEKAPALGSMTNKGP